MKVISKQSHCKSASEKEEEMLLMTFFKKLNTSVSNDASLSETHHHSLLSDHASFAQTHHHPLVCKRH